MDRTLWALAGPIKRYIIVSVVLGLLITGAYIAQGALLAFALNAVLRTHEEIQFLYIVAGLAAVLVARGALLWLSEVAAQWTAECTKETLRERLLAKLIELGPAYANSQESGKLQHTVIGGVEAIETYYSRYMPSVFVAIFGCLGVLATLAVIDATSALVLAPFVIGVPAFTRLWRAWRGTRSSRLFTVRSEFGSYLLDSLQGLTTLKAFTATVARRMNLVKKAIALRLEAMRTLSVSLMRGGITGLLSMGGVAVLLSWNAWRVAEGTIEPIVLFMALFLGREAFRPLDRLEKEFHAANSGVSAGPPIAELLAAERQVRETAAPALPPATYGVAFEEVSFAYDPADRQALANVSFTIEEHQKVALVGPSGAGKSTIISLVLRLFDPQQGAIRIGGTDIKDLSLAELRAMIAVVSQDTFLFHGTIADNLRIAKPDASDEELRAAAAAAHIDHFISGLPAGYETQVGERGARFSGGQQQRFAIARALLKDAPILVLDEATSSVDPASDLAIQTALERLFERRTTIVIAHRLETVRNADRILVFDRGEMVESGVHDELVARGGLYSKLTATQAVAA